MSSNPNQSQNPPEMETRTIDALLQRYLSLLDEYTALRGTLHTLQASIFQGLARANFAAERGVRRYGQDYYDERMQACRRVRVRRDSSGGAGDGQDGKERGFGEAEGGRLQLWRFTVGLLPLPVNGPAAGECGGKATGLEEKIAAVAVSGDEAGGGDLDRAGEQTSEEGKSKGEDKKRVVSSRPGDADSDEKRLGQMERSQGEAEGLGDEKKKEKPTPNDPLRWFGILTPLPLRQAQEQAIKAVEEIIPRLATLSAEMAEVELEVRRARKRRAKAEKAEEKRHAELEDKMGRVNVTA